MSVSAKTPATVGSAPWKADFLSDIGKMESPEFVFSSLQPSDDKKASTPYVPRARTCIFRGMWAELPENKHNEAPMNDRVYESDLLTLTTDVRMAKVPQIMASCRGHGDVSQSQGSGGGGPVEAVFWAKETKTQWRFRGGTYIVGPDIEGPEAGTSSGIATVKHEIGERMRVLKEEGKKDWSWEKELTAHFGGLAPYMRGTFRNPPPGTPVSQVPEDKNLKIGQQVHDLNDETARKNFRVLIIKPEVVELCDLSDQERPRRYVWNYVGVDSGVDNGEWTKEELWP